MPILATLLRTSMFTFFCWVVVYVVGVTLGISIRTMGVCSALILLAAATASLPRLRRSYGVSSKSERLYFGAVVAFGLALAMPTLLLSRPDADDVGYMHELLVDSATPSQPFSSRPFNVPFGGNYYKLQGLAELNAYEALVVTTSSLLRLDTVNAYHNVFPVLLCIAWAVVYGLLLRRFRVGRRAALLGLLGVAVFLVLDGNVHRSFGNFGFVRLWQGKSVAITILVPALLYFCLRFSSRPTFSRGGMILATAISIAATNRSSVFLVLVLLLTVTPVWMLVYARGKPRHRRLFLVAVAAFISAMALLFGFVVALGLPRAEVLGGIEAMKNWQTFQGTRSDLVWWQDLYRRCVGQPLILVRNLWFLFAVPFLVLKPPLRRFLPALSLGLFLLTFSPWAGALWYFFLETVSWRLYLLFPVPLCAGIAAAGLVLAWRTSRTLGFRAAGGPILASLVSVGLVAVSLQRPVWSPANEVSVKPVFEYRFEPEALAYSRELAPAVRGKRVLAPNSIANIWALTEPASLDLVYPRMMHAKKLRTASAEWNLTRCPPDRARSLGAFMRRRPPQAEVMILRRCKGDVIDQFAREGFVLVLIEPEIREAPGNLQAFRVSKRVQPVGSREW